MSIFKKLVNLALLPFFDPDIFESHYFKNGFMGYRWAIRALVFRNLLRLAPTHPYPVGPGTFVSDFSAIDFSLDDLNNFQSPGCYFQCFAGKISIGQGTFIAPNVGIITANHDPQNLKAHIKAKDVSLGRNCWIGMNSVILPGVELAENVIVGAGSVVTKSFHEPNIVIAGNPAAKISK